MNLSLKAIPMVLDASLNSGSLQMPASHKHPPGPRMLPGTMLPLQKSQGSHKEDITV